MNSPYCGSKSYVFLSYSHQDAQQAQSLIRNMQKVGYRVWYDEGITPGTEWDETIALRVKGCGLFLALMSRQYLSSSNCKDELSFARDLDKPRLIVYLEKVELSEGMQMRLNRLQAVFRYQYGSEERFYQKIFAAEGMEQCREAKIVEQTTKMTDTEKKKPTYYYEFYAEKQAIEEEKARKKAQDKWRERLLSILELSRTMMNWK